MRLSDMAAQYAESARLLTRRIGQLRTVRRRTRDTLGRQALSERIHTLELLRREARELEELTAGYYERGR